MLPLTQSRARQIVLAALVVFMASLWLLGVPNVVTPRNYIILAALVTAFAAVASIAYNNAQPTGSIGQVLHEAHLSEPARVTIRGAGVQPPPRL